MSGRPLSVVDFNGIGVPVARALGARHHANKTPAAAGHGNDGQPVNEQIEPSTAMIRINIRDANPTEQAIAERHAKLDRWQYEADKRLLIRTIGRLCNAAQSTMQTEDTEAAHAEAMALRRLLALLEARDGNR